LPDRRYRLTWSAGRADRNSPAVRPSLSVRVSPTQRRRRGRDRQQPGAPCSEQWQSAGLGSPTFWLRNRPFPLMILNAFLRAACSCRFEMKHSQRPTVRLGPGPCPSESEQQLEPAPRLRRCPSESSGSHTVLYRSMEI
jgi:hypothetical protein